MRQRLEDPAYRMRFGAAYLTRKVRALEQRTLSKVLALEQRTLLGYLLRPSSKRLASRALHADGLNIHELMHLCSCTYGTPPMQRRKQHMTHARPAFVGAGKLDTVQGRT